MPELTLQQAFDQAVRLHRAGRLQEAENLYRQILQHDPKHARARHRLGFLASQSGHAQAAVEMIREAISLGLDLPEVWVDLGNALLGLRKLDEAVAAYRRALQLKPDDVVGLNNLGNALREMRLLDQAIDCFHRAIVIQPGFAGAYVNLAIALKETGDRDGAIAAQRQALALSPNSAQFHCNLAGELVRKGQMQEAADLARRAIALSPGFAGAHNTLGNALMEMGQLDDAIAEFKKALAIRPAFPYALNNLGNALVAQEQLDEAIAAFRQAIALAPSFVEAHSNLGGALKETGQVAQAIACMRRAVALRPDWADFRSNLLLALHYDSDSDAHTIAEAHRQWNLQHALPLAKFIEPLANDPSPDRRLRIGYVSPDFRQHVVGWCMLPLLSHHDRQRFEIICYAQVSRPDAVTAQIQTLSDQWRNTFGMSDEQLAAQIRRDGVDILVDLALHTADNRLLIFARRPAPVQATYLGYCGTTGMDSIDYRLSDPHFDPPESDLTLYSEKTIRLPETFWCYQPAAAPQPAPPPAPPPLFTNGFITFGCLNNLAKVSSAALNFWIKILSLVSNSHLLIHGPAGAELRELKEQFPDAGIAIDRVSFIGKQDRTAYLQTYSKIDIALDPFPFNGGITTCDALWMGVPVVTLSGSTSVGRGGRSILSNIGLPEFIAFTPDQYVAIATDLANDPDRLRRLRQEMRQRMLASPLMNAARFTGNIEAAYRQMWHHRRAFDAPGKIPGM